jgi:Rrf2 family protein
MISQTAEYALRAAIFLAEAPGEAFAIPRIAEATQVPAQYLAKVMQDLARQGLVTSRRGVKGGYALARAAADVSLFEIVQAVDPFPRITSCPLGLASHRDRLCSLHARIDHASAAFEAAFRGTTLAMLLAEASRPAAEGGRPHPLR